MVASHFNSSSFVHCLWSLLSKKEFDAKSVPLSDPRKKLLHDKKIMNLKKLLPVLPELDPENRVSLTFGFLVVLARISIPEEFLITMELEKSGACGN